MKKASSVLLSLFISLLTLVPPPAVGASPRSGTQRLGRRPVERHAGSSIPGSYLVVLRDDTPAGQVEKVARGLARAHGGSAVAFYRHALRGFAARLSERAAEALARDPRVALVEEDAVVELAATQTNAPWGLDRTDQRDVWLSGSYAYSSTGAGAHVYVIDSGIRTTHEEFGGRASVAFDNVGDDQTGEDCFGHGTQVAGVVGGETFGAAKEAELHAVRVFNCSNTSTLTKVIEGIDFVTSEHLSPAVALLSVTTGGSTSLDTAVGNSITAGVTYVVAAGNINVDAGTKSPARVAEAITVGATDNTDARATFSNYGASLDLFAPGVDIPTANWFDDTATITQSGTSLAAAHVAGLAARYLSANPSETPAAVSEAITSNATADKVSSPGTDSPNLLLYRSSGVPGGCFDDDSIGGCQDMLGPCQWLVHYSVMYMSIHQMLRDDGYGPKAMVGFLPPYPRVDDSHYLRAYRYGLDVPAGDSVTAVTVTVERRMSEALDGSEIVDNAVHLVKDGVVQTAVNKADTATPWAISWVNGGWVSKSYVFTGGDLSGWTAADFEDDDFGVAFSAKLTSDETGEINNTEAEVDTIIVTLTTGTNWW